MTAFVSERFRHAQAFALLLSLLAGLLAWTVDRRIDQHKRIDALSITAELRSVELMSRTMNGSLMGSMSLMALIDWELKREVKGDTEPNMTSLVSIFESIGRAYQAEGVFAVGGDGVVKSSWDNSGKPSTGADVSFRPYYEMAMRGKDSVYAAVSMARGGRSLYFTSAVHAGIGGDDPPVGAVVARTGVRQIEEVLGAGGNAALLLSPQGVVFASNRAEWVNRIAGDITPQRLKSIRDVKQFGATFEKIEPTVLPFDVTQPIQSVEGRRHALASAEVRWNDPQGPWRFVILEDLEAAMPLTDRLWVGACAAMATFALLYMLLNVMRSEHVQRRSAAELQTLVSAREQAVMDKARLARGALRLQLCKTHEDLGHAFLTELHDLVGVLQGAVYIIATDEGISLRLLASYGCSVLPPDELSVGEGLVGQCAAELRDRYFERPEGEYWKIGSGLGQSQPAAGVVLPLMLQERLVGVVEVAMLSVPGDAEKELLRDFASLLAVNSEIQRRNTAIGARLAEIAVTERKE